LNGLPDARNHAASNAVVRSPAAPTGGSALQAPAGLQPSASYSFTMRIRARQSPRAFARVAAAVGERAILAAIDLVRVEGATAVRDVTVACIDPEHAERVVGAVRALEDVTVDSVSDRTFLLQKGGKIAVREGPDHHA
jgi:malate dehydrogenase (oxaloacetate-decarboxylating)